MANGSRECQASPVMMKDADAPIAELFPMTLRRVFVDAVRDGAAFVEGARAHHLARAVRLKTGEAVEISDGERLFAASALQVSGSRVAFAVGEEIAPPAASPRVTLGLAIVKFSRLEWAVEKATELGVEAILPIVAARSEKRLVREAPGRLARWRRIAEEAAMQARRMAPPVLLDPVPLDQAVVAEPSTWCLFLDPAGVPLSQVVDRLHPGSARAVRLLVGPEGGWSSDEIAAADQAGCHRCELGPLILRAETAAVTAAGILMHLLRCDPRPGPRS